MDINRKYKRVLADLYSSVKGLYAFTLYSRYGITPSDAVSFMEEYKKEGVIKVDRENRISLTVEGRHRIIELINRIGSPINQRNNYLKRFMASKYIEINAPYLPDEVFYTKLYAKEADKTSR